MAIQHVDITDPNIHEPKGASTASIGTVYVADGAGSGSWEKIGVSEIDTTEVYPDIEDKIGDGTIEVGGRFFITTVLSDVSTAGSVIIPIIRDCTVIGASCVLGGAITTNDATVTFNNSAGASMGSPVTIANSGSAKGTTFSFTATGNNVLTGPTWIEIATDGASDTAQPLYVTVQLEYVIN
jgi:hypothetical protein